MDFVESQPFDEKVLESHVLEAWFPIFLFKRMGHAWPRFTVKGGTHRRCRC